MKAVILAAGKGTRMGALAKDIPKSLLPLHGKPLIEYKIEALPDEVDEVILVIGHLGDKIRAHFDEKGGRHAGKRVSYVVQEQALGSAHALWQARHLLDDRFIVLCGDDLYAPEDIALCLSRPQAALVYENHAPGSGGAVAIGPDGAIEAIVEGAHQGPHLVATGLYVLSPEIFDHEMEKIPGREEYGLPQTLIARGFGPALHVVKASAWLQMNAPEHMAIGADKLAPFTRKG